MDFYHIQKLNKVDKEWSLSQIIDTDAVTQNPFIKDILFGLNDNFNRKIANQDILLIAERKLKEDNCYQKFADYHKYNERKHFQFLEHCGEFENLVQKLSNVNLQYLKWIREEIFEKIRLEVDPGLPSRKKCVWLSSKKDLVKWWGILDSAKRKIYKIEVIKGKMFTTDEHYCQLKNFSIEEFEDNARMYWNGNLTDNPINETLFEGKFKVIQTFDSLGELEVSS